MQSVKLFSQAKQGINYRCFQNRNAYAEWHNEFLDDEKDYHVHILYGPKGSGKTTFLKLFAKNNTGVFYYPTSYSDLDEKYPFQNLVNSIFFHVNVNPMSWIWTYSYMNFWPKPDFNEMIKFFSDEDVSKQLQSSLGKQPIFILDDVNLLKEEKSRKYFLLLVKFMKMAADTKKIHVILSGSEGWFPLIFKKEFDKKRIMKAHVFNEFTQVEALNYFKCLREKNDSIEFLESVYEALGGSSSDYTKLNGLLKHHNFAYRLEILIEEAGEDFHNANIRFSFIRHNRKRLELTVDELKGTLSLMYKLIHANGRLKIDEATDSMIHESIIKMNVFKVYLDLKEDVKYIDFQTNMHRFYAEKKLGYRGNETDKYDFMIYLKQEYNIEIPYY